MKQSVIYKDIWVSSTSRYYIDESANITAEGDDLPCVVYESSNGHKYALLRSAGGKNNFYPVDHIMMFVFKRKDVLKNTYVDAFEKSQFDVIHLDGNNGNDELSNLDVKPIEEEWVDVVYPEYVRPGMYEISNMCHVRYKETGKLKRFSYTSDKDGYVKVNLIYDTPAGVKYKNTSIHRLMALHFVNNPDDNKVVNHIDGDKFNNNPMNLEWTTFEMNSTLASMTGLYSTSNVTTAEVDMVIELLLELDGSIKDVYDAISHERHPNISYPVISCIKYKYPTYIRPEGKYDLKNIVFAARMSKLADEEIEMVVEMLLDPKYRASPVKIYNDIDHARYPNITITSISRIKNKTTVYSTRNIKYDINSLTFPK